MLKEFKPRLYQETIFNTCSEKNTLVVLPTGMGKTAISMMLAKQRLLHFPGSKVIVLAPTKPLVEQHLDTFKDYLDCSMAVFTGNVAPVKRGELWSESDVIFSTPQGLENDIISGRIGLDNVSLIVFDEAHKATGDYAYNFIAKEYDRKAKYPRILGLTASPGSELETINEVCENLYIEDIEIRTDEDADVRPYIQEVDIEWVKVPFPESMKKVRDYLDKCYKSKLKNICELGYLDSQRVNSMSKVDILKLQGQLHGEIAKGVKEFELLKSLSLCAEAMKVQHALELIETQGVNSLRLYMDKLRGEASTSTVKAVKNLVVDENFKSAYLCMDDVKLDHPKLLELKRVVRQERELGHKVIVFNQFRDTASLLASEINGKIFFGQAKKNGISMSQKEQKRILEEFSSGRFDVLVATSVAEEGLDIPKVDTVIFYEPIPSAIRTIQRRGRTGRLEKGRVIVLMTNDTRDVGHKWSSYHKEKRMYRTLEQLKKNMNFSKREKTLNDYMFPDVRVLVDYREKGSKVIKELMDLGVRFNLEKLEVGDYVLSHRCCVEFKTVQDFVDSIVDGRLLEQVKSLKENYQRPVLVVEGVEDIYSVRNVHPNAIRGMIAAITVSYGVPIIFTKSNKDTANQLAVIAKREQEEITSSFNAHGSRKPMSVSESREYVVSALPGVGPVLAKLLLEKFGTVLGVMNASLEELAEVDGMGEVRAKRIRDVIDG